MIAGAFYWGDEVKTKKIQNVIIVGGGTAGWNAASLLAKTLGKTINIKLIESDVIGIVGVGEATIPPIINFNNALGFDEADFIRETNGSIKLGIQFENWNRIGDSYMHAFGNIGKDFPFCSFHHFWVKSQLLGINSNFWDFCLNYQTAIKNKFAKLDMIPGTSLSGTSYAYHFDASLYAAYLRKYSEENGVQRLEGIISDTNLDSETGFIQSVVMENGEIVSGDLFIDCSGFRGLLIEQALHTGYEDWTHWLPCDRAIAVPTTSTGEITPYTRSIAHKAGWQWRIPLQHRTGNGHVYCSSYIADDEAEQTLLDHLDGEILAQPRVISFQTGRRKLQWNRNCIAFGLASGFLEPLESTSIHLLQSGLLRLIKHFPHNGIAQSEIDEYNRQSKNEFEHIRDFIILHYRLNSRTDSQFWIDRQTMSIPDSLKHRIDLFQSAGKVFKEHEQLFAEVAWQQVMMGQGVMPRDYHPTADSISDDQLEGMLMDLKTLIGSTVDGFPSHSKFLASSSRASFRR